MAMGMHLQVFGRIRKQSAKVLISGTLFLAGAPSLAAESLPDHVSYRSLCCFLEELKSDGVKFTFETGQIEQLDESAIRYWEGKEILFMRPNNPFRLFSEKIKSAQEWLEQPYRRNQTTVEFQRLTVGQSRFLITLYSTSPVTRTSAIWSEDADFRFSVHGDLLAVDPPRWNRKSHRLYFWNPTGSDLAIVDYFEKEKRFEPVLAVFGSEGTFNGGQEEKLKLPMMRREHVLERRMQLFDHFSQYKKRTIFLPAGQKVWHLATVEQMQLIAYRTDNPLTGKPVEENSADSIQEIPENQPEYFFRGLIFTTAWIAEELP